MVHFIHTSDIHLGYVQYGLEERFKDYARTFNELVSRTIDAGAEFLLISGDLFDKRNINAATYLQAYTILSRLREAEIPVYAIEGNHDQAYYRDRHSWLQALDRQGLLNLIKLQAGKNELKYLGDYRECGNARIFGIKYIGAATKSVMEELAEDIREVNKREGKAEVTILAMHFGMEGQLKRDIGGEIPLSALAPLKGLVDYLALGHYHMQYELDGWVYNGGSPDLVSMEECDLPKGFYEFRDGKAEFLDSRKALGIRDARRLRLRMDNLDSPAELYDAVESLAKKSVENFKNPPLVDLVLSGDIRFSRIDIDRDRVVGIVQGLLQPLHVNLKMQALGVGYTTAEQDLAHSSREEIERKVFLDKIRLDTRYQGHGESILAALLDAKERALRKAPGEELAELMREAFERLGQIPLESVPDAGMESGTEPKEVEKRAGLENVERDAKPREDGTKPGPERKIHDKRENGRAMRITDY